MKPLWQTTGRLGNQMFQFAFLYAYAKEHGCDYYFQDPKYFEKYANEIKALYGDITWAGIKMIDKVSIHIRRGDYVGNSFYVDLMATDYYQKAMAEFPKGTQFLVFSDDIEWCQKQEVFQKACNFSFSNTELEDLNEMMTCNGHIIANSTFSWWGAWLGKGKVIAPKAWYADGVERTVCPKTWIRL
jgi:hypothetical protein